jgi:hypothetical protein
MRHHTLTTLAALFVTVYCTGQVTAATAAIVEVPVPLRIDAQLDDWTANTATHGIRLPSGQPAAAFRLAADDTYLYALFEVVDDSPLKNGATVLQEILKGGDAVGLALASRKGTPYAQRILVAQVEGKSVIMALRPSWDVKQPHTFSSPVKQVKMDYVGPIDGAKAELRVTPGGYIAEIALPWAELKVNRKDLVFDAQVIFSDPAGTTNVASGWWNSTGGDAMTVEDLPSEADLYLDGWGRARLYSQDPGPRDENVADLAPKPPGIPIHFTISRDSRVSLVITDESGFILRELMRAEETSAGDHVVEWDGRDRYDEVLAPGTYRWKLISFDAISSRFIGSVGNSARPPYRTEDGLGSMGGQHGGASYVATDANGIFLMGGVEEGHPSMRAIAPDGRTLWKRSMGSWGRGVVAAAEGGKLYIVRSAAKGAGATLWCMESASGKKIDIGSHKGDIELGDAAFAKDLSGMTIVNGVAYLSLKSGNRLVAVDLQDGKIRGPISIEQPHGIAAAADGTLLVLSGNTLKRIDLASGRTSEVIGDLEDPAAIAVDPDGHIYISELGKRQQVRRCDASGKKLGFIGSAGGRPADQNPYNPNALRQVVSLAVGPQR